MTRLRLCDDQTRTKVSRVFAGKGKPIVAKDISIKAGVYLFLGKNGQSGISIKGRVWAQIDQAICKAEFAAACWNSTQGVVDVAKLLLLEDGMMEQIYADPSITMSDLEVDWIRMSRSK